MKKITFTYFQFEYSEKDTEDIKLITKELKDKYLDIMHFFNLERLERKVFIKLWDNLNEYRNFFNERMKEYNKKVPEWEVGRSISNFEECRIDLLNLEETKKCRGHQNDTIDSLIKVCIHEFVHTCHYAYNGNKDSMTWFSEALATNLSNQYRNLYFNCSLNDILDGKANYINYYSMGKYLIDNCDKNYILELAKNKELLERDTANIYDQTLSYVSKKDIV